MNFCDTLKVAISKLQEPQEGVIVPEHILTFADKLSAVAEDDPSSLAGRVSPALQAVLSMVMEKTPAKLSTETKDQLIHWFGLTQLTIPPEVLRTKREVLLERFNELYAKVVRNPLEETRTSLMNTLLDIVTGHESDIQKLEWLYTYLTTVFGEGSVTDALLARVAKNTRYRHDVEDYLSTMLVQALHGVSATTGIVHSDVDKRVKTILKSDPDKSAMLLSLVDQGMIIQAISGANIVTHQWAEVLANLVTEYRKIAQSLLGVQEDHKTKASEPSDSVEPEKKGAAFNLNVRMVGNPNRTKPPMEEVAHALLETQDRNDAAVRENLGKLRDSLESVVSKIPNEYQGEVSQRVAVVISLFDNEQARDLLPSFDSEFMVAITGNILAGRIATEDLAKLLTPFLDRWIEVLHDRING